MEQLEMNSITGQRVNGFLSEAAGDTIGAISTPNGVGGIAVIRVSGPEAIRIVDSAWKGKRLTEAGSHTAHLGKYLAVDGRILDECVATVFRAPATFTGEDVVEISIHGSRWLQREVLNDLINRRARAAEPGEFTRRAFLNGRIDLAQAEGIADLIAASSKAAHSLAVSQTSGRFSKQFEALRDQLIEFASLLELELDFSEEDVEFADREKMLGLSREILREVERLRKSYSAGRVIKEGIPVVIAGVPNAGKSSLLNLLLNDDKAIVSNIPGTTRDIIEDTLEIEGYLFRLVDTAGLRDSEDEIESIGIERAKERVSKARNLVWVLDVTAPLSPQLEQLRGLLTPGKSGSRLSQEAAGEPRFLNAQDEAGELSSFASDLKVVLLANKSDLACDGKAIECDDQFSDCQHIPFCTKTEDGLEESKASALNPKTENGLEESLVIPISAKTGEGLKEYEAIALDPKIEEGLKESKAIALDPKIEEGLKESLVIPISTKTGEGLEESKAIALNPKTENGLKESLVIPISTKIGEGLKEWPVISFSTKTGEGLENLQEWLVNEAKGSYNPETEIMITNARHYEALSRGSEALRRAIEGIETGISGDFIAQDVREALHHFGTITGTITTPTLLQSIFSRFCVGK